MEATSAARASSICSCVAREGRVGLRSMVTRGCDPVAADAVAVVVVGGEVALRDVEPELDGCGREELDCNDGVKFDEVIVLDGAIALLGWADGVVPRVSGVGWFGDA